MLNPNLIFIFSSHVSCSYTKRLKWTMSSQNQLWSAIPPKVDKLSKNKLHIWNLLPELDLDSKFRQNRREKIFDFVAKNDYVQSDGHFVGTKMKKFSKVLQDPSCRGAFDSPSLTEHFWLLWKNDRRGGGVLFRLFQKDGKFDETNFAYRGWGSTSFGFGDRAIFVFCPSKLF